MHLDIQFNSFFCVIRHLKSSGQDSDRHPKSLSDVFDHAQAFTSDESWTFKHSTCTGHFPDIY